MDIAEEVEPKHRVENMGLQTLSSIELANRIRMAINSLEDLAWIDGEHHKLYAIDQAVQHLLGEECYSVWREGRPDWDRGIAP